MNRFFINRDTILDARKDFNYDKFMEGIRLIMEEGVELQAIQLYENGTFDNLFLFTDFDRFRGLADDGCPLT